MQTKLKIRSPGGADEQQAEDFSQRVMRMPESAVQRACACGGECSRCRSKAAGLQQQAGWPQVVASENGNDFDAPSVLYAVVGSSGQPLDRQTRQFFEPRFDHDFGEVRIHADAEACDSTRAVNALAYTVGPHIVFSEGKYSPHSSAGRQLLAHELTHVVQQGSAQPLDRSQLRAGRSHAIAVQRQPTTPATHPGYEPDEISRSRTEAGHLAPDAFLMGNGKLLIGDFGVDWRHVKQSTLREPDLRTWIERFEADETYRLEIVGYSDSGGSERNNTHLRQGRAEQVERVLGPRARSRVTFRGMAALGEYVADNNSVTGRAGNRGVVIKFSQVMDMPEESITVSSRDLAVLLSDTDLADIDSLLDRYRLEAAGLFLEIYRCLTSSIGAALRSGSFEDPLWLARVNHFAMQRLVSAFRTPNAAYKEAFVPCEVLDYCMSPDLDVWELIGCQGVYEGTGILGHVQACTTNIGRQHLLTDLRDALSAVGCASPSNKRDYAAVVPLFEACNRGILSDQIPVLGGPIAGHIAIPLITRQRNQAWSDAECL